MRPPVDLAKLEAFRVALGKSVRGEGRIYLTGGTTALMHGWRPSTIDVDLKADPEPQGWFEALAKLKDDLGINIELASPDPDQFVPALPGWRDRSIFIARHGSIDFYHYDLYGQALSKLERAHERDRADVLAMKRSGLVNPSKLTELFERIEAELIRYPGIDGRGLRAAVLQFNQEAENSP